jgi:hypothetical protein
MTGDRGLTPAHELNCARNEFFFHWRRNDERIEARSPIARLTLLIAKTNGSSFLRYLGWQSTDGESDASGKIVCFPRFPEIRGGALISPSPRWGRWTASLRDGYLAGWRSVREDQPVLIPLCPVLVGTAMYMVGFSRGARDAGPESVSDRPSQQLR